MTQSAGKSISASEIKAIGIKDGRKVLTDSDSDTLGKLKSHALLESSGANLPSSSGDLKKMPKESSGSRKKKRVVKKRQGSLSV